MKSTYACCGGPCKEDPLRLPVEPRGVKVLETLPRRFASAKVWFEGISSVVIGRCNAGVVNATPHERVRSTTTLRRPMRVVETPLHQYSALRHIAHPTFHVIGAAR